MTKSGADLRNVASQRVAQKCGFIHLDDIDRDGGTPIRLFRLGIVASRL
ncbi:hypothetical protein [Paramuribaculum intestinale]|nr:hypothetical protein [Paramuribaculum intestinale]